MATLSSTYSERANKPTCLVKFTQRQLRKSVSQKLVKDVFREYISLVWHSVYNGYEFTFPDGTVLVITKHPLKGSERPKRTTGKRIRVRYQFNFTNSTASRQGYKFRATAAERLRLFRILEKTNMEYRHGTQ